MTIGSCAKVSYLSANTCIFKHMYLFMYRGGIYAGTCIDMWEESQSPEMFARQQRANRLSLEIRAALSSPGRKIWCCIYIQISPNDLMGIVCLYINSYIWQVDEKTAKTPKGRQRRPVDSTCSEFIAGPAASRCCYISRACFSSPLPPRDDHPSPHEYLSLSLPKRFLFIFVSAASCSSACMWREPQPRGRLLVFILAHVSQTAVLHSNRMKVTSMESTKK